MPPTIRVCLADHHRLFHLGIETILKQNEDMVFSGSATNEEDSLRLCQVRCPHLLLLALNVLTQPITGFLAALQTKCPDIKVIVLLAHADESGIPTLLEKGIHGCILKSDTPEHLVEAVRRVVGGENWISSHLLKKTLASSSLTQPFFALTDQQKKILLLLTAGKTDRQIAEELQMSERTIRRKLADLYERLGATNRAEAAFIAGQCQLPDLYP
ncbi:MAG: response regulator transcription factor [Chloroflexi bacterium]|nr:DNA-binding response regulator [Chloroflexota bacterium]NOG35840.1 response regulator transcription factor [Chloroflexota bacterium]GIK55460.1 MAG: DNA-binding response regulator [Chloroflexota bacterium]